MTEEEEEAAATSHLKLPLSFTEGLLQRLHPVHLRSKRLQLTLQLLDLLLPERVRLLGLSPQRCYLPLGVVHLLPQHQNVLAVPANANNF